MNDTRQNMKQTLTYATVNKMVRILHEQVRKDSELANNLLQFMKQHHIEVPILSNEENQGLIPVSFTQKKSSDQFRRLRNAFDGIEAVEQIL